MADIKTIQFGAGLASISVSNGRVCMTVQHERAGISLESHNAAQVLQLATALLESCGRAAEYCRAQVAETHKPTCSWHAGALCDGGCD